MEIAYVSIAVLFTAFVLPLLALSWKLVKWAWLNPKNLEKLLREQGFNGNPYRLLIGDLKEISSSTKKAHSKPIDFSDDIAGRVRPEVLHKMAKYGKNTYIWYGPKPAILIQDSELVRQASQDINLFQKPNDSEFSRLLTPGLVSYNGAKWAKHRKLLNPAFRMEKLKHMLPSFYSSSLEMLGKWEQILSPQGFCELDVWPSLSTLSSDAISRTAFGSNYEQGRRIFELQEELVELCYHSWSSFFPGGRFLPTTKNRRMREIEQVVNGSIRKIISARMNAVTAGKPYGDDLLGILLESSAQEIDKHGSKEFGMTIEDVIKECKLFYFAGQETTSLLLVWTMILLSRHEDWQTRAREEVWQLFGNNQPEFDSLNRLKVVNMILHEALRMYPPLPVNGRITAAETKLGDKTIPAGVLVFFETLLTHYDTEIWGEDAKEFKPDRFAEGTSNATKGGQLGFFPFGAGPRICIGQNFAMLEAKLVLAMILQRFSFQVSASYAHAPRSLVTLKPQYGAHLILRKL